MQLFALVALALTATSSVLASPLEARAAPVDQLVGYGAGTTGGGSGPVTVVTSCAQLTAAFGKSSDTKNGISGGVIKIQGTLANCGVLRLYRSNTSIVGVGSSAFLSLTGIRTKDLTNIIIRNLKITPPEKADAIDLETTTKVWVDHCDLSSAKPPPGNTNKDLYDGLLDAKAGSDFITVSWTKFHDHWKGTLIGHSDSNASEDTGKLHITYHHNSFNNINSRQPSLRFGTAHIYSSCFGATTTSGINSRMGAQVLVENNSFTNVNLAIVTNLDSDEEGFAVERNNLFSGSSNTRITKQGSLTSVPYSYSQDPAASVCSIIAQSAGVGVVTF